MFWRRITLSNSLRVLLFPRLSANTAQLSLAVEFGSNQEPEENAGVAHFLEHMLAGGSIERILLARNIETKGGILDFYTDHEHMLSTLDVLPEELTEASVILSELIFNKDFNEEKFNQERKIILNELAEAADDPTERIEELLLKSLFKKHPIKRPVGGFPKTVKRLTIDQLINSHSLNYVPQNMILILTGGFSEKTAKNVLKKFENLSIKENPSRNKYAFETAKPVSEVFERKAGIVQTYLSIGARTTFSTHQDAPKLDLLSAILSGGTSSRLFIEMRENNALTYDVNSDNNKGLDFGYLSVNCAVKDKNLAKAKKIILKEITKLRTEKVPSEELERNKNLIIGGILRGMDNPREALEIISYLEIQFKNEMALVDYIAKVKAVSSDDILEVANTYLQEDSLSTVFLEPLR